MRKKQNNYIIFFFTNEKRNIYRLKRLHLQTTKIPYTDENNSICRREITPSANKNKLHLHTKNKSPADEKTNKYLDDKYTHMQIEEHSIRRGRKGSSTDERNIHM